MNPANAPYRSLCTDCGISRTSNPKRCGEACQFIKPNYPELETQVHGRARDISRPDELHFGPFIKMLRAGLKNPSTGAQWTGITTRIGERLLETGAVDAILTMTEDPHDRWKPLPIIIDKASDMAKCRGMRMGYAPLLSLLEPAIAKGYKKMAVIGIPCQVYALRALEKELGLEKLYVIGTPCSDNTTTENFHHFLSLISSEPDEINYLEFRADYHVEIRFKNGKKKEIPFLQLPLSTLPNDFFPLTCRTCVDYTNVLSLLGDEVRTSGPGTAGKRHSAVVGFMKNVERAAGGLPLRKMPNWLRPIVGWLMPKVGPRGLEFARTRVEMKAIETVLHLRREQPAKMASMVPGHIWPLVESYGIKPSEQEIHKP